jgi:hypothetical protein
VPTSRPYPKPIVVGALHDHLDERFGEVRAHVEVGLLQDEGLPRPRVAVSAAASTSAESARGSLARLRPKSCCRPGSQEVSGSIPLGSTT